MRKKEEEKTPMYPCSMCCGSKTRIQYPRGEQKRGENMTYLWGLEARRLVKRRARLLNGCSSVRCYRRGGHLRASLYNRGNKASGRGWKGC